jgi:hypothetical protein
MYNFKKSQYYPSVNKTRKFMFEDLDKTINLIIQKDELLTFSWPLSFAVIPNIGEDS